MNCKIDHIVIGAASLEEGVRYVRETLGVTMPKGGSHAAMTTHNHLMSIGNECFLEIIAADHDVVPTGERLKQPRWYGLDDPFVRARLAQSPTLLTWVVNTGNITATTAGAAWPAGTAVDITRGDLSWAFALPVDGSLPGSGMLPYIMQWHTSHHPAVDMQDLGVRLEALEIRHPHPDWVLDNLSSIDAQQLVQVTELPADASPTLVAHLSIPDGNERRKVELISA